MEEWTPAGLSVEELHDGESYHRALYPRGSVDVLASWHAQSSAPLVAAAAEVIEKGDVVVDYGAGSGGSAIELLKMLDAKGIEVTLVLVDPLPSWLSNAWRVLHGRSDVHFILSTTPVGPDGRREFLPLPYLLRGVQADVIVSSSTLHLVPQKALPGLVAQWRQCLRPNGRLFWSSGDLQSPSRPAECALLHDPYRRVRALVREDPSYQSALRSMPAARAEHLEREAERVFPPSPPLGQIMAALEAEGFLGTVTGQQVPVTNEDATRFILVNRLSRIAAAVEDREARNKQLVCHLATALAELRVGGQANEAGYRSWWSYGNQVAKG